MRPETFKQVYQSLKREEGRNLVTQLYLVNQGNHGTTDSISNFAEMLAGWAKPDRQKNEQLKSKLRAFLGSSAKKKKK